MNNKGTSQTGNNDDRASGKRYQILETFLFPFVGDSKLSLRIAGRWQAAYRTDLSALSHAKLRIYTRNESRLTGDFDAMWRSSVGLLLSQSASR